MRYGRVIVVVLFSENDTGKVFTNNIQDQAGNKFKGSFCPKFYHLPQHHFFFGVLFIYTNLKRFQATISIINV